MSPSVAELLLQRLERAAAGPGGGLCSLEAAAELGLDHQTLVGAVKSLQALGEVIEAEARSATIQSDWGGKVSEVQDGVQESLRRVQKGEAEGLPERDRNELKRRKLLLEVTLKSYWIRKGSAFSTALARQETELTPEMIATGSWRKLPFKPYNFSALGLPPAAGHLHPLLKVRSQLRTTWDARAWGLPQPGLPGPPRLAPLLPAPSRLRRLSARPGPSRLFPPPLFIGWAPPSLGTQAGADWTSRLPVASSPLQRSRPPCPQRPEGVAAGPGSRSPLTDPGPLGSPVPSSPHPTPHRVPGPQPPPVSPVLPEGSPRGWRCRGLV
ncbi:PREDICTED: phenylalanine--tRNA ligase alpha subunit [Calidris pugnax]|uniref:phenylalanine--tRNA ligase alpha subunit n=1 Tax=Calidris pugnax TaxID=198806 RepID=UPI00071CC561|nr:PREDICTED: phenylalanine--tRNA ligase alpha subunit [Calidris pugnax]